MELNSAKKKEAEPEESSLAEFNDRTGVGAQAGKLLPKPSSLKSRNKALEKLRRMQAAKATSSSGPIEEGDDEELFSSGMKDLVDALQRGGPPAAKEWISKRHDLLERHELLRHAVNSTDGPNKQALGQMLDDLKKENGDKLASILKDADALKTALHKMDAKAMAAAEAGNSAGLRNFRSLFNSSTSNKLDGPSEALTLASRLQSRFGTAHFAEALKEMRTQLASQMHMMNKASELGPKVWLSMSDANSFRTIQSTHAIAMDLRRDLSDAKIVPRKNEGEATIVLLSIPGLNADAAVKLKEGVVGRDDLSPKQRADMYRLFAKAVNTLPITLWPEDKSSQRTALIGELRDLSGSSADEMKKPKETPEEKLERTLREQIKRLKHGSRL